MGGHVEFEWDSRDLKFWRGTVFDKSIERAMKMAGNKVIKSLQDKSVEHVVSRKNLQETDVREGLPLIKPGRKAVLRDMVWREDISGEPMPLSRFPFYSSPAGIVVSVNKGSVTRIKSAFVARMPKNNQKQDHGHLGIFKRRSKDRFPIQELWTSRLSDVMSDAGVIPKMESSAIEQLAVGFERGLARELRKLRRSGEI